MNLMVAGPQSDEEVRAVVEGLQRLDPLLDVIWNPEAILRQRAEFDVFGCASKPAKYDARWQVIRHQTANLHDREYAVICTVTECDRTGKYPIMIADGDYAPLGEWLVEYMRLWDRAQSAWMDAMDYHWAEHERAEAALRGDETAGNQEALEKIYREHGGAHWIGGGQGRTENAPWLGDSAVRQRQQGQKQQNESVIPSPR